MQDLWFTADGARMVDRLAIERYGLPSIVLMENAAIALREAALELSARHSLKQAIILAGPGNNGGDGFALARHLHNAGLRVRVLHTAPRDASRGDAAVNLRVLEAMRIPLDPLDSIGALRPVLEASDRPMLLVDALLGTGTTRPVTGLFADVIEALNARGGHFVLSVDIPSGMDADRGPVLGPCVRADMTVTFVGRKVGMAAPGSADRLGRVVVGDIGVPRELAESLAVGPPC